MYIGRFAPSPTGPLHFGSLIAAVASFCEAKKQQGRWLVRMEDLDKPRVMPGAAHGILKTLEQYGFEWDGDVIYQSKRSEAYEAALEVLKVKGLIYPCTCSRKEISDSATTIGIEGAIYPKTCLKHAPKHNIHAAYRVLSPHEKITFKDQIQGNISQNLAEDIGDFVLKRADGIFAYQLAVVVDDAAQEITHIVRGADLLNSTPRQLYLQGLLGMHSPAYAHLPVAVNHQGEKLSKQTLANPITPEAAPILVFEALVFLGQNPPDALKEGSLKEIWRWAFAHWDISSVPTKRTIYKD